MTYCTSLLDRAKRHLRSGAVKAGALAIVPLASVQVSAAGFTFHSEYVGFGNSGGGVPADVTATHDGGVQAGRLSESYHGPVSTNAAVVAGTNEAAIHASNPSHFINPLRGVCWLA